MNQYRFNLNDLPSYDGPPCPRVVKCNDCNRIMEAPLLGKADDCCLASLRGALSLWLENKFKPHMDPTPLDMAMAQVSLDSLIYDMRNGLTEEYIMDNPKCLDKRDVYMNKKLVKWLRKHGFRVSMNNGIINAEEITQIFTGEQSDWEQAGEDKLYNIDFDDEDNHDWTK